MRFYLPIHWTSYIISISQTGYTREYIFFSFSKPIHRWKLYITWGAQRFMPWEWSREKKDDTTDNSGGL